MKPLNVYLCDLTHDSLILVSDTIPINIGFVASFAKHRFGKRIEVSLFKLPKTVIDRIRQSPPDVIALSNYSWNSRLSEFIAGFAKRHNPDVVTVQGGTNFPHEAELQLEFIKTHPNTDFFVDSEGEISFAELIARVLEAREGGLGLYEAPTPGCVTIDPATRGSHTPAIIRGPLPERLKELDSIPSPYLNGMLDHFFDGVLTPFLETNRGCPFKCTFCHTGNDYFNKINMFSIERITEEIRFIAPRAAQLGIINLHIADTNFGMYPRDREICEALYQARKDHGWPHQIMATTGKNSKQRVIEITKIMGNMFSVNMSVQSMDSNVLSNIKRDNIRLDDYIAVNKQLNGVGRSTKGELILGMPGETRKSFVRGVRQIIDGGVSSVCIYTLMLLHGTPFKTPSYRKEFDIKGKYRLVPLNFGEYAGTRVFDVEEAGISTKDMSFKDYLWLRGLALSVEVLHNNRPFITLFHQARVMDIKPSELIMHLYESIDQAPQKVREILKRFMEETEGELWSSEEALVAHYAKDEHYSRLLKGEVGGNLIYKYKAISLAYSSHALIEHMGSALKRLAVEKNWDPAALASVRRVIDVLMAFEKNRLAGVLDSTADTASLFMKCSYDILGWLRKSKGSPLSEFSQPSEFRYEFLYTNDQLVERKDYFLRYGTHVNALSKIVTRVSNVESLFRTVQVEGAGRDELQTDKKDDFVRYALSN